MQGNTLTLQPTTREEIISGGRSVTHLQQWTLTRDATAHVHGQMAYQRDTVWEPSLARHTYVSSYVAEVLFGVLNP